jgi:hypothetical protein
MRVAGQAAACAVLLGGATALAFFTGGYFDEARAWAGVAAWALVLAGAALAGRRRWSWSWPAALAVGGLALLGAWTLASIAWAPVRGSAYHAGQIVFLYLGALIAAALLLGTRRAIAAVEPALAGGAAIVVGYGLAGRLLPGVLHFSASVSAQGRLEQPLTYWNAMGELAALGLVLCTRVAGDGARPAPLRRLAVLAGVPLALGLYTSFSRGALFAAIAGLVALVVAAPRTEQLRAIGLVLAAGVVVSAAVGPLTGVTSLHGSLSSREWQGAVALAVLIIVAAAAVLALPIVERGGSVQLPLPRRAPWIALGAICAGLALAIAIGAHEGTRRPLSAGSSRLVTLQSNRYAYWRVAFKAFGHEPLRGVGAGGWSVWWLRYRTVDEFAQDAHSLPLQTLAELGLIGLALLTAFVTGVALVARRVRRVAPPLAAGPIAGLVCYAAHAPLDWDWQMPAVTLVAIVLGGGLIAVSADAAGERRPRLTLDSAP